MQTLFNSHEKNDQNKFDTYEGVSDDSPVTRILLWFVWILVLVTIKVLIRLAVR